MYLSTYYLPRNSLLHSAAVTQLVEVLTVNFNRIDSMQTEMTDDRELSWAVGGAPGIIIGVVCNKVTQANLAVSAK